MKQPSTVPYDTISTITLTERPRTLFTKCCFCVPIRIGCFVLAYLNLIAHGIETVSMAIIVTYFGLYTNGFSYIDSGNSQTEDMKPYLISVGTVLIGILCANLFWLIIIVACIVGLHKRRSGPVRLFVGLSSFRLILSLVGFIYLATTENMLEISNIIGQFFNMSLSAYFMVVYFVYALQMEREQKEEEIKPYTIPSLYQSNDKTILVA